MAELKITRLHLREYKAIRALDLPDDGLGWGGVFPDVVVVGGGNGSGKTTLLRWIVAAMQNRPPDGDLPLEARIDVGLGGPTAATVSHVAGDGAYVDQVRTGSNSTSRWTRNSEGIRFDSQDGLGDIGYLGSRVVFVPSPRDLVLPPTTQRSAGTLRRDPEFVHVWTPPRSWVDSAEAQLYEARWLDLNAKEEGRPEDATNFSRFANAFSSLLPGRALTWRNGELVVEVVGSDVTHDLSALSSGEKQILVLLADLLRYWAPGSIVLIDEPELHLHPSLQIRFYEALVQWRAERGGQLWLATQSTELFGHAADGTKVLLGSGSLA